MTTTPTTPAGREADEMLRQARGADTRVPAACRAPRTWQEMEARQRAATGSGGGSGVRAVPAKQAAQHHATCCAASTEICGQCSRVIVNEDGTCNWCF